MKSQGVKSPVLGAKAVTASLGPLPVQAQTRPYLIFWHRSSAYGAREIPMLRRLNDGAVIDVDDDALDENGLLRDGHRKRTPK
jgi:hypothetical protein